MILKTKIIFGLVMCAMLGVPTLDHCAARELTVREALDILDGSLQSIKSFDVWTDVTRRQFIITERTMKNNQGRKEHVISSRRTLAADEKPAISHHFFHQVFHRGRGRIDFLNGHEGKTKDSLVYDSETQKIWNPESRTSSIARPHITPVQDGMDYRESYLTTIGRAYLMKCLRERKNVRIMIKNTDDPLVILETSPAPKTYIDFPNFGFRVTIDPRHGFMPVVLETLEELNGKLLVSTQRTITDWKDLGGGVWTPTRMVSKHFDLDPDWPDLIGKIHDEMVLQVGLKRSSWNQDIPESTFELPLPAGAIVTDFKRKVNYVTGEPDPGKNLDDLAAHARQVLPMHTAEDPPSDEPPPGYLWFRRVLISGLVAAVCLTIIFVRRRGKRFQGV